MPATAPAALDAVAAGEEVEVPVAPLPVAVPVAVDPDPIDVALLGAGMVLL
jgi:antitoxin (DNA-binding transcriptional repressor) of toxin-antitoxin stability system